MSNSSVQLCLLSSFEDSGMDAKTWNDLVAKGSTDVIFLSWQWQKAWWEVFSRGKLLLVVAKVDERPIAIAPLFAEEGMIFFLGSGGSDYLDFIGKVNEVDILESMLLFACQQVREFLGFRFYHVPEQSITSRTLSAVASRNGWHLYKEGELPAPKISQENFHEKAVDATRKKSLLRHQAWFERNGELSINHLNTSRDILPHLNDFFEQHKNRWAITSYPSVFHDPKRRLFYQRVTELLSQTGWLRFTRVIWNLTDIAYHFGFNYKGNFLWYKPSFEILFAKHSPGEVLLRQLLLHALKEQAHTFDFGLGDEAFKQRFATGTQFVDTWGLYPSTVIKENK